MLFTNNENKKNKFIILFLCFSGSVFFYMTTTLLYTWSTPKWLSNLPNVSGYRFIQAIKIYFICSTAYFYNRAILLQSGEKEFFLKEFSIAFLPVLIFSAMVILNTALQKLQLFTGFVDILIWIFLMFIIYRNQLKVDDEKRNRQSGLIWFWLSGIQVCLGVLFTTEIIPGFISAVIRLAVFGVCCFDTIYKFSKQLPTSKYDVVERYKLSQRETEVLSLIACGKTNDEIADSLYISVSTVKTHISAIFRKTGTRNRLQASTLHQKDENHTFD